MRAAGGADWLHCDVMDGRYVPNISFGVPVVEAISRVADGLPLDVHLMIEEPGRYVDAFAKAGATTITVHYEACPHLHRVVEQIKRAGCAAGVALNPHTPVALLSDIVADLDLLLVMSVNPGFGGQKFIQHTYTKVAQARALLDRVSSRALIEVDGGVDVTNIGQLVEAGADVLVAGSSVFGHPSPLTACRQLRDAVRTAQAGAV